MQNLPDGGRCPGSGSSRSAWNGSQDPPVVQEFGNLPKTLPGCAQAENFPDNLGLLRVDNPLDVQTLPLGAIGESLPVVIPKDTTTRHMPGLRLPDHGVVGPLSGLLPFQLVGKGIEGKHHLV
ncbi:MAG: hypothetical protein V3U34_03045 [candidate division NC10 bacterium]